MDMHIAACVKQYIQLLNFPVNNVSDYCRVDANWMIHDDYMVSPVHIYDNKLIYS